MEICYKVAKRTYSTDKAQQSKASHSVLKQIWPAGANKCRALSQAAIVVCRVWANDC